VPKSKIEAGPVRRRKLLSYMVLVMLEHGQHGSVTWHSQLSGSIRTGVFARSLQIPSFRLKSYMELLKRRGYLSELTVRYSAIDFTLTPPRRRYVDEAATDQA
jgi:hypothetical protein